ncbi:replicative DNA helicase [Streptomyces roseoverticillatus]|uniref:replicative DNA helicase n=1 Tax=Streptomyces roseoverticillatus TaxID=66429 RepID=UPI003407DBFF
MTVIAAESAGYPAQASGFDRVPPHDIYAEQAVLGSMMLSTAVITEIVELEVTGADFYQPAHETVFEAALHLYTKGKPVDPITVTAELGKRGDMARAGGAAYLHKLVQAVPTAANAAYYAKIIHEHATLRRLIAAGTRIVQSGYQAEGDVEEIVDAASAELNLVTQIRQDDHSGGIGADFGDMVDELVVLRESGRAMGIPTGFTGLDSLMFGLHPGQMIIIASRPALGKSTLATDFARAASIKHGHPTAFFSLEMSRRELQHRIMSAEAQIPLHRLRGGTMTETDWERFADAQPQVTAAPLHLDCEPSRTVMQIKARARRLQQRDGLDLVIIDYLQLIQSGGNRRAENRQIEVSEMSRSLKLMAKELGIPVIVLAQLNRGPEQRADKKPILSDLRESGALEQDADVVILLHREDAYNKESSRQGEAELIVAKHRNGRTAAVTCTAQLQYSKFTDMATV